MKRFDCEDLLKAGDDDVVLHENPTLRTAIYGPRWLIFASAALIIGSSKIGGHSDGFLYLLCLRKFKIRLS